MVRVGLELGRKRVSAVTGLATLVDSSDAILLDFDGPVCSVFAGYPAEEVASQLRQFLLDRSVVLPPELSRGRDPLKVLRWVGEYRPGLTRALDDLLSVAEITAVQTATPTRHAHDVILAADRTRRSVAIVSNNAEAAIIRYLALHGLSTVVTLVVGRAYADPARMKPHPDAVVRAVKALGKTAGACLLVGDSVADIKASRSAGVHPVGYAKTPSRRPLLVEAGAEVVVHDLGDIAAALDAA
ncbi:MAG: HAD-IA family hydrolase [Streptosporangiales bacterium]|nr:HAD-IA family hydrolase [Streptosporangiales bacterium]